MIQLLLWVIIWLNVLVGAAETPENTLKRRPCKRDGPGWIIFLKIFNILPWLLTKKVYIIYTRGMKVVQFFRLSPNGDLLIKHTNNRLIIFFGKNFTGSSPVIPALICLLILKHTNISSLGRASIYGIESSWFDPNMLNETF